MAGDWIPWTKGLSSRREVLAIAQATGRDRRVVACLLVEFWEWADTETEDGFLPGLSVALLSSSRGDTDEAFWRQVVAVGWLREESGGIRIPNFDRWLGRSAKRRLNNTNRKRQSRLPGHRERVALLSPCVGEKSATTEQNRTDYKTVASQPAASAASKRPTQKPAAKSKSTDFDVPPELDTPEFRESWKAWLTYLGEKGKRYPSTVAMHAAKLRPMGAARAAAALDHSRTRCWNEPFEPNDPRAPPGGAPGADTFEARLARAKEVVR